ncbi:MAG: SLC13 family permease [bacterium]
MTSKGLQGEIKQSTYTFRQRIGLYLGIPIFVFILLLLPKPSGLSPEGHKTLAVAFLMAWWWITEALPIAATALIPLAFFPILGIMNHKEVAPNYADSNIMLLMGGFFLAVTMQKWGLHKRLALRIVHIIGTSPGRVILGFMTATAFISMWISNTSTTLMMYPIALAVVLHFSELEKAKNDEISKGIDPNIQTALMLGIAYSASVGGIGTLIGTPPNVIFAGAVSSLYPKAPSVEFFRWMLIGIPLVVIFIPLIWICLTRIVFPISLKELAGGRKYISAQLQQLGRISRGERLTLFVFLVTAFGWIFRRDINLGLFTIPGWSNLLGIAHWVSDTTVAIFAALLMFAVPVNWHKGEFLLDWKWAVKIPWGILILFGGGIALAKAFQTTGLATWIGSNLTMLSKIPVVVMILIVCLMLTFLTEVTSNTAMTTLFMPILAATALAMNTHPFLLMIPATMSASCAFMLPVATPPNAVIFGSGHVTISDMAKAGIVLNLIGAILITGLVYLLAIPIFGITPGSLPNWVQ